MIIKYNIYIYILYNINICNKIILFYLCIQLFIMSCVQIEYKELYHNSIFFFLIQQLEYLLFKYPVPKCGLNFHISYPVPKCGLHFHISSCDSSNGFILKDDTWRIVNNASETQNRFEIRDEPTSVKNLETWPTELLSGPGPGPSRLYMKTQIRQAPLLFSFSLVPTNRFSGSCLVAWSWSCQSLPRLSSKHPMRQCAHKRDKMLNVINKMNFSNDFAFAL